MARQLTAFARFCTLRHLDLDLLSRCQVFGSHTEATRCNLLDLRAQRIARHQRHIDFNHIVTNHRCQCRTILDRNTAQLRTITFGIFTAFAGIRFAAYAVHRNRERRMGFGRDRTERHRASDKTFDDFFCRFDFIQRNRTGWIEFEFEQAAQSHVAFRLIIDDLRVLFIGAEVIRTGRVLQFCNRIRRPHVLFTTHAVRIFATCIECICQYRISAECRFVQAQCFFCYFKYTDTFDVRRSAFEVFLDQRFVEADGFKNLRAAIRHIGRNTHF